MRRKAKPSELPTFDAGKPKDDLVPDPAICDEFSVSSMTIWRWDRDPKMIALGWPLPVYIRRRKFRSRNALEGFKNNLLQHAIAHRRAKEMA
jgi:hypothetical protein